MGSGREGEREGKCGGDRGRGGAGGLTRKMSDKVWEN